MRGCGWTSGAKQNPLEDPVYKQRVVARRKTVKEYYLARSRGGEMLKKLFGPEKSHLIESLIF